MGLQLRSLSLLSQARPAPEQASEKSVLPEISVAAQWLRLLASTAERAGSIPGWGTKIPHAKECGQTKIKK